MTELNCKSYNIFTKEEMERIRDYEECVQDDDEIDRSIRAKIEKELKK